MGVSDIRTAADAELASLFDGPQVKALLNRLSLEREEPSVPALNRLIRAWLGRIPFQNVTMLARPRRAPTLEELREDVLLGRGGPCGVMNPAMAALLHRLGYDVCLISGSMQAPDCHIALLVRLAGVDWWLDVGNGHPYLEAVALGDERVRHYAGLTWRMRVREPGLYAVEHLPPDAVDWKCSYEFRPHPRPFSFFEGMIRAHYTQPGYGPFLLGLRLIRYPSGHIDALRDQLRLRGSDVVVREMLPDESSVLAAAQEIAGDADLPLQSALDVLRWYRSTALSP